MDITRATTFFLVSIFFAGVVFLAAVWSLNIAGADESNTFLASTLDANALSNSPEPDLSQSQLQSPTQTQAVIVNAQSAFSVDADSGNVLFAMNPQQKLPIASLTKLMTALVVLQKYDMNQKVIIDEKAMAQEGEQGSLKLGDVLSVKDLLYISLIESSNRAAFALSEVMGTNNFIAVMNITASNMGLLNTRFEDSTGLSAGSYSTAQDIAKLSAYLLKHYPLFGTIVGLKEYDLYLDDGTLHRKLVTTNKLLGQFGIIGGKTGWTNDAKGCFMAIQQLSPENYSINVILGADDRFLEMQHLLSLTLNHEMRY
jgi:D-alanyl-D-alanine carboxypeptidase